MIQKLVELRGIGRFHAHKAIGEVTFRPVTLIYGENGRGKSTLADVLRSLATGDTTALRGRKTVGPEDIPITAQINIAGDRPAMLTANGWSRTLPNIAVFDSVYVRDNVHAGDTVTRDHKRNLYRIVVGQRAVALAKRLDDEEDELEKANFALKQAEAVLRPLLVSGYDPPSFVRLVTPPDVDTLHQSAVGELALARRAAAVVGRGSLGSIALPAIDDDLSPLLATSLASLSAEAEVRVRDHLKSGRTGASADWLESGLGMIREDRCPFCDQDIAGVELIASYRAHFDAAYADLQAKIAGARTRLLAALGDGALVAPERAHGVNARLVDEWRGDGVLLPDAPSIDWVETHHRLTALRVASLALIARKAAAPLEALVPDEPFRLAREAFEDTCRSGRSYSAWVEAANAIIAAKRKAAAGADVPAIERRVGTLAAQQKRAEPSVAAACDAWKAALGHKEACVTARDEAKKALNKHTDTVFAAQEQALNQLLEHFGASFRLTKTKHSYVGGERSCEYRLTINGATVELGRAQLELEQPGFASLLSSGDKSTLALAFFLLELDGRPDGETIVVFDDPFTSQDASRRFCTRKKIVAQAARHAQVIVLSHDDRFLRSLHQDFGKRASPLRLDVGQRGSTLVPWDVEAETSGALAALEAVFDGAQRTHRQAVHDQAKEIRRYLETRLRLRFVDRFGPNETLGGMIDRVADAGGSDGLAAAKPLLDELRALKEFTNPLHHGEGAPGEVEDRPLDPDEVTAMIARARDVASAL